MSKMIGFGLVVCGLLLAQAGCQPNAGRRPKAKQEQSLSTEGLTGGKLLLEDKFSEPQLAAHWIPKQHPKAKVVDGWLHLQGNRNEPPLWLNFKLPERVRIEFDARSRSGEGDIKFEVFGDGQKHASGYILVMGAHNNAEDWLARLDEHGADRQTQASKGAAKDKVYRMAVVRTDNVLRWFVDGQPFMSFNDEAPLKGEGHHFFAFNDWNAPLEFDNLQVFSLE
jgi:hypothetical protein